MTQSTVTTPAPLYIGLDVGDRKTHLCALNEAREVVERCSFPTTSEAIDRVFKDRPAVPVVLEVGPQSPWMSRRLSTLGHDVLVADARRVAAITRSGRKTDRRDAEVLARLLNGMPEMLGSVHHRGRQAQADLAVMRARDVLVSCQTSFVLHIRGTLKALGLRAPGCSAGSFHHKARTSIPVDLEPALAPILDQLEELGRRIRSYDRELRRISKERYPETSRLTQVVGVGPLTSLAFVLTVDNPERFKKSRTVGAWVGLCPRVQASGDSNPQLSISKSGDQYLRRLLVQSANYILGPFGPDSDLRRFGQRLSERGGKAARRRAVVAVARRLAVLLHRLWVSGKPYEPLRNSTEEVVVTA